jgi:hypothetical protein
VAARLADAGLCSLDDPVADHVPELRSSAWARRATLRGCFGVDLPALGLDPSPGAAGDLSRFSGVYAWPDRRSEVTATGAGLVIDDGQVTMEASPIDGRTFLVDAGDPDTPTVAFGEFDDQGRPGVLYEMVWAYPRA